MAAVPTQCEAMSLRGRHASIARSVARLLAVAGFALAGWIALAALNDAAMADDGTSRSGAPLDLAENGPGGIAGGGRDAATEGAGAGPRTEPGLATLRHFKLQRDWSPRETTEVVADDVREVGRQPVRYLHERRQDVFRDKDEAVRAVRELRDAAGVPTVSNVRVRDTEPKPSVLAEIVHRVTDARPLQGPQGDAPADAQQDETPETSKKPALPNDAVQVADNKYVPAPFADAVNADELPAEDGCTTCRGGHGPLDAPPALPGQDAPRSGSASGGHLVGPFADLATAVDPAAAPLGMTLRTFERTALTDIAAPGRPAVVPD